MRMIKYALIALAVMYIYILFDTVVGCASDIIGERIDITNPDFSDIRVPRECYHMEATAYCLSGKTASGERVRQGIVASKPEWIGKKIAVYNEGKNGELGSFIGYFDVKDTGSKPIREGRVIDIWMPSYDQCMQFGRRKVVVYVMGDCDEKIEEIDLHSKDKAV